MREQDPVTGVWSAAFFRLLAGGLIEAPRSGAAAGFSSSSSACLQAASLKPRPLLAQAHAAGVGSSACLQAASLKPLTSCEVFGKYV